MVRRHAKRNWYLLRGEAEAALRKCEGFPSSVRIDGKLNLLGAGLNHENYWFWIEADAPLPRSTDTAYVLRKLGRTHAYASHGEAVAHLKKEAMTLQALTSQEIDFAVPRFVCFIGDAQAPADGFIETALPGMSLNNFERNVSKQLSAIDMVARIASAVHRSPLEGFHFLPGHADRNAHVLAELEVFPPEFVGHDADAATVAEWVRCHLPADRPTVFLHGDLLPQNVLWDRETDQLGVVDWEYARIGDPAYDLAIVTRGHAKPFGCPRGLQRLVDSYRQGGGAPITATDVVNYELLLVLGWLEQSVRAEREERREGHPPSHWRNQIRAILRRAKSL